MTSTISPADGTYDFFVKMTPGRQTVRATFAGSNEIRKYLEHVIPSLACLPHPALVVLAALVGSNQNSEV